MNNLKFSNLLSRVFPIALTLFPIGVLFGLLAKQAHWDLFDVLLLSSLGFTGSGQFTYLSLSSDQPSFTGSFIAFFIILSLNLRYIPMSLSASRDFETTLFNHFILAHCLADESYAIENQNDSLREKAIIRLLIFGVWVVSTVFGVIAAEWIPIVIQNQLSGFTFPVTAILFALATGNIFSYINNQLNIKRLFSVGASIIVSIGFLKLLGMRYFWIPSIAACFILLSNFDRDDSHV